MVSFNQEEQKGKMKKMKWWGNHGGVCHVDGLWLELLWGTLMSLAICLFWSMVDYVKTLHRDLIVQTRFMP